MSSYGKIEIVPIFCGASLHPSHKKAFILLWVPSYLVIMQISYVKIPFLSSSASNDPGTSEVRQKLGKVSEFKGESLGRESV